MKVRRVHEKITKDHKGLRPNKKTVDKHTVDVNFFLLMRFSMQRIKGIFTILFSYTLVLLVYGCASCHHETQQKLREYSSSGRYDEAVQFLNASSLNKDKNAQLIVYMEKGLLNHNAGKYQASLEAFEVAKKLVGELFTTRISGKLQSAVSNDNADLYYGEKYEA